MAEKKRSQILRTPQTTGARPEDHSLKLRGRAVRGDFTRDVFMRDLKKASRKLKKD